MHPTKVRDFEEKHDLPFPSFEHLNDEQCLSVQAALRAHLGLSTQSDLLELVLELERQSVFVPGENADDEAFDLTRLFERIRIRPSSSVLINWYRFDDIDRMLTTDVERYLLDLWYPGAEDIDILDNEVGWVISICHHGAVYIFVPEQK